MATVGDHICTLRIPIPIPIPQLHDNTERQNTHIWDRGGTATKGIVPLRAAYKSKGWKDAGTSVAFTGEERN